MSKKSKEGVTIIQRPDDRLECFLAELKILDREIKSVESRIEQLNLDCKIAKKKHQAIYERLQADLKLLKVQLREHKKNRTKLKNLILKLDKTAYESCLNRQIEAKKEAEKILQEADSVGREAILKYLLDDEDSFDGIDHCFFGSVSDMEETSIQTKYPDYEIDSSELESLLIWDINSNPYNDFLQMLRQAVDSLSDDEVSEINEYNLDDEAGKIYSRVISEYEKHYQTWVAENLSKQELIEKGVLKNDR